MSDDRFDEVLASVLAEPQRASDDCPDAEALAAFWERSLPTVESRDIESHVAACARCQAHLVALHRTDDAGLMTKGDDATGHHRWRAWWWLTPLAATAVVVLSLWALDPRPLTQRSLQTVSDGESSGDGAFPASAPASAPARTNDAAPGEPAATNEGEAVGTTDTSNVQALASRRDIAPPTRQGPALGSEREERVVPQIVPQPTIAPTESARLASARYQNAPEVLVTSASGRTVWRATLDGIERSLDGGRTWSSHAPPTGERLVLLAGSSPGDSVCWLVGRFGAIIRTLDGGETWERVRSPATEDLVGIDVSGPGSATIRAASGLVFRTSDAGSTWTSVP